MEFRAAASVAHPVRAKAPIRSRVDSSVIRNGVNPGGESYKSGKRDMIAAALQ
jgi:hypothetical protein